MTWVTVERPGYFGSKLKDLYSDWTKKYGKEGVGWRLVWAWGGMLLPEDDGVWSIYERGYFMHALKNRSLWEKLGHVASDVYDNCEKDIESGTDYRIQKSPSKHLQDIAIRRVMRDMGIPFEGRRPIQIRNPKQKDEKTGIYWGKRLAPGKVVSHMPGEILDEHLESDMWDRDSIEDFYQSNKLLQVRTDIGKKTRKLETPKNLIWLPEWYRTSED